MGFHQELDEATRIAVREMIDFLVAEKHLSRDDAYMLISVAGDVDIAKLVIATRGCTSGGPTSSSSPTAPPRKRPFRPPFPSVFGDRVCSGKSTACCVRSFRRTTASFPFP